LFFIRQTSLVFTLKGNLFILKIPKCLKKIKRFFKNLMNEKIEFDQQYILPH